MLALFGSSRYSVLMGRLALPILMSIALSPFLAATAFQAGGANLTLRTYYVARHCKRVAGQFARDANTTALRVSPWLIAAHRARHHRRASKRFCQMMGGDITVESEAGAAQPSAFR